MFVHVCMHSCMFVHVCVCIRVCVCVCVCRFEKVTEAGSVSYSIVGFASVYGFYAFPDKVRWRIRYDTLLAHTHTLFLFLSLSISFFLSLSISLSLSLLSPSLHSQMLILPPFQRKGHGGILFTHTHTHTQSSRH